MATEQEFQEAYQRSTQLSAKPPNDILLKMYSLYKQATIGDINIDKPGGFDFVGMAKYNAWEGLKGTSKQDAMDRYVELINSLS